MNSADQTSALVLAYIGDAVFETYVRDRLVALHDCSAHALHVMAKRQVCAASQARLLAAVEGGFTEKEREICKRAKNAKPGTIPRSASRHDYMCATALEAVIGYVHMNGDERRLNELMELIFSALGEDDGFEPKPLRAFTK